MKKCYGIWFTNGTSAYFVADKMETSEGVITIIDTNKAIARFFEDKIAGVECRDEPDPIQAKPMDIGRLAEEIIYGKSDGRAI